MQLVLHAPFGSRVNRAWGLALRKKFCQGFNFELQAAATEEGVILSLGPSHSFPLDEAFRYLHPNTVRETLIQAVLDSPIFETRWRWTTTLALAVPRNRHGVRVPAPLQRMYADDLLQGVFPDAAACLDNIQGAREIPDHPLVNQAMRDALEEAMDLPQLVQILQRMQRGEIRCLTKETPEPSVFCHELLNSAVYTVSRRCAARRAPHAGGLHAARDRAAQRRRSRRARSARRSSACATKRGRSRRPRTSCTMRCCWRVSSARTKSARVRADWAHWSGLMDELVAAGRAVKTGGFWVSIERFEELDAVVPQSVTPAIPERIRKEWTREDAARELVRGRMEVLGPVTGSSRACFPASSRIDFGRRTIQL